MTNAPPSVNPANEGSMVGMLREVLGKFLMQQDDMIPAKIVAFDRTTNLATVQPMIMMVSSDGQNISRAQVASVPVFQIGGGGFVLNFNLNPGDLGFLKANDRDISLFMQSFLETAPNTYRMHSFEDALFFPAILNNFTINDEDAEHVVLQTLDGSQRVAIWPDRVKITSDHIIMDAPLTTFTGAIVADGSRATSNAEFNGTIHTTGDVIADTISLQTHVHSGVQSGASNTGEPVP